MRCALKLLVERRTVILPILILALASCGPKGFHAPIASTTTAPVTTYTPPKIVETKIKVDTKVNGKKVTRTDTIADGATAVRDTLVTTDGPKGSVHLKGTLILRLREGGAPLEIPMKMGGLLETSESTGYGVANLSPLNHPELRSLRVEASAKLMCLAEDCSEYFVNIYVRYNNQKNFFYRHQIHQVKDDAPVPTPETAAAGAADIPAGSTAIDTPKEELNVAAGDYLENDSEGGVPAYYVGETSTDLGDFDSVSTAEPILEATSGTSKLENAGSPNSAPATAPTVVAVVNVIGKRDPVPPKAGTAPVAAPVAPKKSPAAPAPAPQKTNSLVSFFKNLSPFSKTTPAAPAKPVPAAPAKPVTAAPVTPAPVTPAAPTVAQPPVQQSQQTPPQQSTPPTPQEPQTQAPPRTEAKMPEMSFAKILNQAIGFAYRGKLQRPDSLLELPNKPEQLGFRIMRPERKAHFATKDLHYMMLRIGKFSLTNVRNYVLNVGDVSYQRGGKLARHDSHQNGLDADISYYFDQKNFQDGFQDALANRTVFASWMEVQQWELFKSLVKTSNVDRIFIHPKMKDTFCKLAAKNGEIKGERGTGLAYETLRRLRPEPSHGNHFHLRLQCSSVQKLCRMMEAPAPGTGCRG